MTNPAANDIASSANEVRTIFVNVLNDSTTLGDLLADSATFRRQRGFHNKATGEYVAAKDFTLRGIRKGGAGHVAAYLGMTGTDITGRRVWLLDGATVTDLGIA